MPGVGHGRRRVELADLPAFGRRAELVWLKRRWRFKRVAFGMTNFRNWRIPVLLYAGRSDWNLLPTITPPL